MADVMPCVVQADDMPWIGMLQHLIYDRYYCQVADRMASAGWVTDMADVITKVADGIPTSGR